MSIIDLNTFDLTQLPNAEDDYFEFKSSQTQKNIDKLKEKISCAVSGFANSGDGCFVIGVDDNGNADGGISSKIGKQDIRDWIDNIIHQIEPFPTYDIKLIHESFGRGSIQKDSVVVLILIHESHIAPHMASDNRYYIRAGAHTVAAKHFIVDAIRAKRHFSKPRLTHLFRLKPQQENILQLGILAITNAPAVNVSINFSPLPNLMKTTLQYFPLKVPIIDQNNPFFFNITTLYDAEERFGSNIKLEVEYDDIFGYHYQYEVEKVNIAGSLPPLNFNNDNNKEIVNQLKDIATTIAKNNNVEIVNQLKNIVTTIAKLVSKK